MQLTYNQSDYPYEGGEHPRVAIRGEHGIHILLQIAPDNMDKWETKWGCPIYFCIQHAKLRLWPIPDKPYELDIRNT